MQHSKDSPISDLHKIGKWTLGELLVTEFGDCLSDAASTCVISFCIANCSRILFASRVAQSIETLAKVGRRQGILKIRMQLDFSITRIQLEGDGDSVAT